MRVLKIGLVKGQECFITVLNKGLVMKGVKMGVGDRGQKLSEIGWRNLWINNDKIVIFSVVLIDAQNEINLDVKSQIR